MTEAVAVHAESRILAVATLRTVAADAPVAAAQAKAEDNPVGEKPAAKADEGHR